MGGILWKVEKSELMKGRYVYESGLIECFSGEFCLHCVSILAIAWSRCIYWVWTSRYSPVGVRFNTTLQGGLYFKKKMKIFFIDQ
jgi:hypothetical protein